MTEVRSGGMMDDLSGGYKLLLICDKIKNIEHFSGSEVLDFMIR